LEKEMRRHQSSKESSKIPIKIADLGISAVGIHWLAAGLADGPAITNTWEYAIGYIAFADWGNTLMNDLVYDGAPDGAPSIWEEKPGYQCSGNGVIADIHVDEEYRRQGIATDLLAAARAILPSVHHNRELSSDGRAWSQRVGSWAKTSDWTPFPDPEGMVIQGGGDAVPGGYNGFFAVFDRASGKRMGYIDYQSAWIDGAQEVMIGMVEVEPEFQRQGIATLLLKRLRHEFPGTEIDPGMTTSDGYAWWNSVGKTSMSYGNQYIARGLKLTIEHKEMYNKFVNHIVTAQDIVNALHTDNGGVGPWWGIMGEYGNLEEFRNEYAWVEYEDSIKKDFEDFGYEYHVGNVGVVLVADRPRMPDGELWDPEVHGLDYGLMGNSNIVDAGFDMANLVEVQFDAGWGWEVLPAQGMRVKAAMDGWIDLYHMTTTNAANEIYQERRMTSKENTGDVFFSTVRDGGQGEGYGNAVVHIRIPEILAELDDEFPDGEQHYRIRAWQIDPSWFVLDKTADYGGRHQPQSPDEEDTEPIWDMGTVMMPSDVYDRPGLYPDGNDPEVVSALRNARGNPNATISIYRALPANENTIYSGNWVTTSRAYAKFHGNAGNAGPDWHVIQADVRASDVYLGDGNSLAEYGYWGPTITGQVV
jgi:ribosomal protein S18 acetylase RimI-like enzyme